MVQWVLSLSFISKAVSCLCTPLMQRESIAWRGEYKIMKWHWQQKKQHHAPFAAATPTTIMTAHWSAMCSHVVSATEISVFIHHMVNINFVCPHIGCAQQTFQQSAKFISEALLVSRHSRQKIGGKDGARVMTVSNILFSLKNACKSTETLRSWPMHFRLQLTRQCLELPSESD